MARKLKNAGNSNGNPEVELFSLLEQHGTFVRHKTHKVFRLYNETVVIPGTSSDWRNAQNHLARVRRIIRANVGPSPAFA